MNIFAKFEKIQQIDYNLHVKLEKHLDANRNE